MNKFDDSVTETLNLPVEIDNDPPKQEVIVPTKKKKDRSTEVDEDFNTARNNISNIVREGSEVLTTLLDLAETSESPRAFEVAADFMRTLSNANKDLMDLHKQVKDIESERIQEQEHSGGTIHVDKAVFTGSTTDLHKMLAGDNDRKKA
jgi:hypothetical protein